MIECERINCIHFIAHDLGLRKQKAVAHRNQLVTNMLIAN